MMTWGQWQTPFDDVMMTSSLTSRFIDYWRNLGKFMFTGIFDPFRVEIGRIWPHTARKRIISAFHRAWPHVKIPTRTEVTAQNVNPICSFLAHFRLLSLITSSIYIRTSPNLVGLLICEYRRSLFNDVMMTSSQGSRLTDFQRKWRIFGLYVW